MSPVPELRALVATLREGLFPAADADTRGDGGVPLPDTDDEERLYAIVQRRGGRVRQQTIVEETDWSASKVSRCLTHMESNGCIGRVTTGREKIVVLPEHLPSQADAE